MKRALFLLILASCTTEVPVFRPVNVEVPVAAPCRTTPVTKPDFALSHISKTDDLTEKTRAALMELDQRRAYETEIEAEVAACQ
jgi:hypothetical protein